MQQRLTIDVTSISTKMSKKSEAMAVKSKSLGNCQQTSKTPEVEHKALYFL